MYMIDICVCCLCTLHTDNTKRIRMGKPICKLSGVVEPGEERALWGLGMV